MTWDLLLIPYRNKYSRFCLLTLGVTYFVFKTINIQKYLRFYARKWLRKCNTNVIVSEDSDVSRGVNEIKRRLRESRCQVLGLDCEWVSSNSRHPVALVQLATSDGFCSLFHLCVLRTLPKGLVELLTDGSILKVGVAVVNDARYLQADYGVRCEGCVDLRHLAARVGVQPRGLANLAYDLFAIEVDKNWRVRCSNWEANPLSPAQIQYAAQDARIAVDIFEHLNSKAISQKHTVWERLFWTKDEYQRRTFDLWSPYVGVHFKDHLGSGGSTGAVNGLNRKPVNIMTKRKYSVLQNQKHYSNIFLLAPDDQILCVVSESKASWYIQKELVDVVCDDPKTLKLRFEPSNRPKTPNGYYTKVKDNRCVVCGCESDLIKKNVVPCEYRKYFEVKMKNHHSHDVLLLCMPCHTRSNLQDQRLRERLVLECDAPLDEGSYRKFTENRSMKEVQSAARALHRNADVIPEARQTELRTRICEALDVSPEELSQGFLESLIRMDYMVENEVYQPHGQRVVQHYCARYEQGVSALEHVWRQHFMDTMTPHHLPHLWSVNHVRD